MVGPFSWAIKERMTERVRETMSDALAGKEFRNVERVAALVDRIGEIH
jgi:hypothetical protein